MAEDTVTISRKEYDYLLDSQAWLVHLEACGIGNWDGYGYAAETFEDVLE